jgi:subtilisin family serine protease
MRCTPAKVAAVSGVLVSLSLLQSGGYPIHAAGTDEAFIVECTRPCAEVTAAVAAAGGVVTQQFDNVDAVAVRVPRSGVSSLVTVAGADSVRKDAMIAPPTPTQVAELGGQAADPIDAAALGQVQPETYNFNLNFTNVAPLHAAGQRGQDVVVAVIDSGTANVPTITALSGSVVGGETFVPLAQDPLPATHRENGSHGTMTAEMVAAHAVFLFQTTSPLVQALNRYAPGSAIPCTLFPSPPNCGLPPAVAAIASAVPMTGTAPAAGIYAMKVFDARGGGAPESRIIAAMDRAITLRRNYNLTQSNTVASGTGTESDPFVYSSLKIDVVNMSLGGPTLFAGRDIEDQLTLAMLDVGITLVTSAGNDGHAAMTGGSPGTGFGSLTVAAASTAVHDRILADLQFGPGVGEIYRPTTHAQTAYFSSRGPTADGRIDPDITANGVNSFVHAYLALTAAGGLADCREPAAVPGTCVPRLVFASGTSFSSPTVAGAAAVLRGGHPTRSAAQIRNSLQKSANPLLLGDDSTPIDQGSGVVDVAKADELLMSGKVSSRLPDLRHSFHDGDDGLGSGGSSVMRNVQRAGFDIAQFNGNRYSKWVRDLKPGEVRQIFLPSDFLTSSYTITIDRVTPALPPGEQNQFWLCGTPGMEFVCGDDVFVHVVDAPTSFDVTRLSAFVNSHGPLTTTIANPQTGLVRVAVQGDWTNGGTVSALVTVTRQRRFDGLPTSVALIEQDEIDFVEVDVPGGAGSAVFELSWLQNWARYPTNDLELVLIDPAGNVIESGATANSPERVEVANPTAGRWTAAIIGFTIYGNGSHDADDDGPRKDVYTFRAEADGKRLKEVR